MRSFLSYMGGKSLLTRKIIPMIPEHTCYCEVFVGAAWLLFQKEESKVEIINDINADLVTLYRVVKHHLEEFVRYLKWILVSRDEFDRFKAEKPETLTDIQRAVRFYYLLRCGYGAQILNPTISIPAFQPPRMNLLRIEEDLSAAHLRLSRVYIENVDYRRLIERVDKPFTFFYLDPPYYGYENYYGKDIFSQEDFRILAGLLSTIKGKFILPINDLPEVRDIYREFNIHEVNTTYTVAGAHRKKAAKELLITNYDLPAAT